MIKTRNRLIPGVYIGIVLSLLISANGFSYMLLNGSGDGYCDNQAVGCTDNTGETSTMLAEDNNINEFIAEGATVYLKAHSSYLSFLSRVELSDRDGLDYIESEKLLTDAIESIRIAKETYYRLVIKAVSTDYNSMVLDKLARFDFNGYLISHDLDGCVFKEVEDYLQSGDITGTYILTFYRVTEIENLLKKAKDLVVLKKRPELENLWKINERLSKTLIFGQYVARIFQEIRE